MPFFCQVCEFPHDLHRDWQYFEKFQMCQECATSLVEARQEEWSKGWRPTDEQIHIYINSRLDLMRRARGFNA
jgi:hypothetical protein